LRSLWIKAGPSASAVSVHLPEGLVLDSSIRAAKIELDPQLAPQQQRTKQTQGGPAEWGGVLGVRKEPCTGSNRRGRGSVRAAVTPTAGGADVGTAGALPGVDGKLDLDIQNGRVSVNVRSWFGQMKEAAALGARAERRPQPYR
jgi:hypothetical protein